MFSAYHSPVPGQATQHMSVQYRFRFEHLMEIRLLSSCSRQIFRVLALVIVFCTFRSGGATIWDGPLITFTEPSGGNGSNPADQDRITPNVWLTRNSTQGLFNAKTETGYSHFASPADTQWAYGALADYASLTFSSWEAWNGQHPPSMVGKNAVVHLESEDIYLSVQFLSWGGAAGGFSYERSTLVPEPSTVSLAVVGLAIYGITAVSRSTNPPSKVRS
jgi:hypothetical protein